jgi:hypothetical protein
MEKAEQNLVNAGLIFMFSVWLQGQMSDLVILKKNPAVIGDFVANPARVPGTFHQLRVKYWEKQFGEVKNEFLEVFNDELSEHEVKDIEEIYLIRNMIGHAHVSMGRDYMLYRPAGTRKEQAVLETLKPKPVNDQSNPTILKLELWRDELFKNLSNQIERLDQACFSRLATMLGVPHGRIR